MSAPTITYQNAGMESKETTNGGGKMKRNAASVRGMLYDMTTGRIGSFGSYTEKSSARRGMGQFKREYGPEIVFTIEATDSVKPCGLYQVVGWATVCKVAKCKTCGVEFEKKTPTHCYCKACAAKDLAQVGRSIFDLSKPTNGDSQP